MKFLLFCILSMIAVAYSQSCNTAAAFTTLDACQSQKSMCAPGGTVAGTSPLCNGNGATCKDNACVCDSSNVRLCVPYVIGSVSCNVENKPTFVAICDKMPNSTSNTCDGQIKANCTAKLSASCSASATSGPGSCPPGLSCVSEKCACPSGSASAQCVAQLNPNNVACKNGAGEELYIISCVGTGGGDAPPKAPDAPPKAPTPPASGCNNGLMDGECKNALGKIVSCTKESDCGENGACVQVSATAGSICICKSGFVGQCQALMSAAGSACLAATGAPLFVPRCARAPNNTNTLYCTGTVVCNPDNGERCIQGVNGAASYCGCPDGKVYDANKKCVSPSSGGSCGATTCNPEDKRICTDGQCVCYLGLKEDASTKKCVADTTGCTANCDASTQVCVAGAGTAASICICQAGLVFNSAGRCVAAPPQTDYCFLDGEKKVSCSNVTEECVKGTDKFRCDCRAGYQRAATGGECKLVACNTASNGTTSCGGVGVSNSGSSADSSSACYKNADGKEIACIPVAEVCTNKNNTKGCYCAVGYEPTVRGCVVKTDVVACPENAIASSTDKTRCVCKDGFFNAATTSTDALVCKQKTTAASLDCGAIQSGSVKWAEYCKSVGLECRVKTDNGQSSVYCDRGSSSPVEVCNAQCGRNRVCVSVTGTGASATTNVAYKCVCADGWFGANCDRRRCYSVKVEDSAVTCAGHVGTVCKQNSVVTSDSKTEVIDECVCSDSTQVLDTSSLTLDSGKCVSQTDGCSNVTCSVSGTSCVRGACVCAEGKVMDGKSKTCVAVTTGDACNKCSSNQVCAKGADGTPGCVCPAGFAGADCNLRACSSAGKCADTKEVCRTQVGTCDCDAGCIRIDGSCQCRDLPTGTNVNGTSDIVNRDCSCTLFKNQVCVNGICKCDAKFKTSDALGFGDCDVPVTQCVERRFELGADVKGKAEDICLAVRARFAKAAGIPESAIAVKYVEATASAKAIVVITVCPRTEENVGSSDATTAQSKLDNNNLDNLLGSQVNDSPTTTPPPTTEVSSANAVIASFAVVAVALVLTFL